VDRVRAFAAAAGPEELTVYMSHLSIWMLAIVALLRIGAAAEAQTVPEGYSFETIASGFNNATCMAQTPDGRILIARQSGEVLVWKEGALLSEPMHTFLVSGLGEKGLLGLAIDPDFVSNGYIYVYITTPSPDSRGKLKRITVPPGNDVSLAESEVEVFDLGAASGIHLGGEVQFGIDGKLYVALGDHAGSANSQSLSSIFGKILRLNADGTIPEDNPFYGTAEDDNRAIWALGLRNPFTFAFEPGTGRMFINDVGAAAYEEINDGIAGANYGWPQTEGRFSTTVFPQFTHPLLAYHHTNPILLGFTGYVIVGGAFYTGVMEHFPAGLQGHYFFGDYSLGWIRTLDPTTNVSAPFATGMSLVVDFGFDAAGRLLVLRRSSLVRVQYDGFVGACCVGLACAALSEADCAAAGGVFQGVAVPCALAGEPAACCTADFDGNGQVEVPDIFVYLSAWFGGSFAADVDGNGEVQVPDIFAFLGLWFAGCSG
jgi:glucose/arabinose dehydrogenase